MDNLLKTTSYVLKDKGAIVYISNDGFYGLKWNSLVYMLKGLAEIEKQGLLDKKINLDRMSPAHQDLCLNKCISNDNIDLEEYKKCYYKKFNVGDLEHTIRNVCKEYMIGVLFVLNYYILGIPSWNWFYKYHRSPFFSDIYSFFENKKHKAEGIIHKFNIGIPLTVYEQLLCILPLKSKHLLPKEYQAVMEEMKEFYPENFEVSFEGVTNNYHPIVILPTIDLKKMKLLIKKFT